VAAGSLKADVPSPCDVGAGGRGRGEFEGYFADSAAAPPGAAGEAGVRKEVEAVDDNDDADDVARPSSADDADVDGDDSDGGGEDADLMFAFDDL